MRTGTKSTGRRESGRSPPRISRDPSQTTTVKGADMARLARSPFSHSRRAGPGGSPRGKNSRATAPPITVPAAISPSQ